MSRSASEARLRSRVPELRVRRANAAPLAAGDHVLYCMTAGRRARHNFALERALEWTRALGRPLLVFEVLRAGYPWPRRWLQANLGSHLAVVPLPEPLHELPSGAASSP